MQEIVCEIVAQISSVACGSTLFYLDQSKQGHKYYPF